MFNKKHRMTGRRTSASRSSRASAKIVPSIGDNVKAGFGLGLGSMLATLLFIGVGMTLFVVGYIMWKRESVKPTDKRKNGVIVTGFILMGFGCLLGMGLGFSILLGALGSDSE